MTPDKLKDTQQYIDFVKNNLEPLAAHLKVSVQWLWNILVNQVRVEAIVYLVVIIMMAIKSTILLTIAYKAFKKAKFRKGYNGDIKIYKHKKTGQIVDWDTWWDKKKDYDVIIQKNETNTQGYIAYWCGAAGVTLALVSTITAAAAMPKIVTGLVNPEYGAIEHIVEFSKGKVPSNITK